MKQEYNEEAEAQKQAVYEELDKLDDLEALDGYPLSWGLTRNIGRI